MMQNLGNRRSVQKCAQKAGSYVLKAVYLFIRKSSSINQKTQKYPINKYKIYVHKHVKMPPVNAVLVGNIFSLILSYRVLIKVFV